MEEGTPTCLSRGGVGRGVYCPAVVISVVCFFLPGCSKKHEAACGVGTREKMVKGLTFGKNSLHPAPSLKAPFPDKHERWFRAAALTLCKGKESAGSAVYGTLPAAPQSLPDVRVRPQLLRQLQASCSGGVCGQHFLSCRNVT